MSGKNVSEWTAATFDEATAKGLAMVDFWAPWCGPCRTQGPIFEEVAAEFGDRVAFGKVNIDDDRDLAVRFGVRSIPTLLLLKDGEVVETKVGLTRKEDLQALLNAR